MQTKVQGLLLSKRPFQENHLLCHILLRNGRKIVTVFYGGRGGGKKNSPSLLELGYMLDLELAKTKRNSDLYRSKEWLNSWIHLKIRENYKAYLHLCFFLEVIERIAPEEDLWEVHDSDDPQGHEFEGLFRVLSNTLFYLEKHLETKGKDFSVLTANFLCKLINQQGFLPSIATCCLSDEAFGPNDKVLFMHEKGGFAKAAYINEHGFDAPGLEADGRVILNIFKNITFQKTAELNLNESVSYPVLKSLFHYFCFQNHLQPDTFKTYKTIFK
jgi:recombinational DNA repair protein (RecF pathway)